MTKQKPKIENVTVIHEELADPELQLQKLEELEKQLEAEAARLRAAKIRMIDRR